MNQMQHLENLGQQNMEIDSGAREDEQPLVEVGNRDIGDCTFQSKRLMAAAMALVILAFGLAVTFFSIDLQTASCLKNVTNVTKSSNFYSSDVFAAGTTGETVSVLLQFCYLIGGICCLSFLLWCGMKQDGCWNLRPDVAESPSDFLVVCCVIFAVFTSVAPIYEFACDTDQWMAKAGKASDSEWLWKLLSALRHLSRLLFIGCQSLFFLRYTRIYFNKRRGRAVLCLASLVALNVVFWVTHVGEEIDEIQTPHSDEKSDNRSVCKVINQQVVRRIYPFIIEYFVMAALFAFSIFANQAKLELIEQQDLHDEVTENRQRRDREISMIEDMRVHSCSLTIGFLLIIAAFCGSVSVEYKMTDTPEKLTASVILSILLLSLHSIGISLSVCLARSVEWRSEQSWHANVADRTLMWISVTAVLIYNFYDLSYRIFWCILPCRSSWQVKESDPKLITVNEILIACCDALNCIQSLMQAVVLEAVFQKRVKPGTSGILTMLLLLNFAEWTSYTICFDSLFEEAEFESKILPTLALPLLVFYRFHSIAYIQELRSQCLCQAQPENPRIELNE